MTIINKILTRNLLDLCVKKCHVSRSISTASALYNIGYWRLKPKLLLNLDQTSPHVENILSIAAELARQLAVYLKRGLPAKGTEYGPLTDLPDWSYADGRPAPFAENQKEKIQLHKSYCEQIIKLTKEVDECFELNREKAARKEQRRRYAIQNRLKAKGRPLE